jgi:hypothetical protein
MSVINHGEVAATERPASFDGAQEIAALRASGAQCLDPVRLHYLEIMSARAQAQSGRVKSLLDEKLAQAVADFRLRLATLAAPIQSTAGERVAPADSAPPRSESLADLVRSLAQAESEKGNLGSPETHTKGPELKSVRLFRNTWSRLSADKQLNAALDQAPKNAGPINSHMLVLRSLALMRELSPDYLSRFISYADTLVHLEQGGGGKIPKARRAR